jgi:hypothetical protein
MPPVNDAALASAAALRSASRPSRCGAGRSRGQCAVERRRAQPGGRGLRPVRRFEQAAHLIAGDQRRQHARHRQAARLDQRRQQRNHDGAEVPGTAGVFLGAAVEQRRVGQRGAVDRGLAPVAEQGGAATALAVERQCRAPRHWGEGRGVPAERDAVAVEQAGAGLLDDGWRNLRQVEVGNKSAKVLSKRHEESPRSAACA